MDLFSQLGNQKSRARVAGSRFCSCSLAKDTRIRPISSSVKLRLRLRAAASNSARKSSVIRTVSCERAATGPLGFLPPPGARFCAIIHQSLFSKTFVRQWHCNRLQARGKFGLYREKEARKGDDDGAAVVLSGTRPIAA